MFRFGFASYLVLYALVPVLVGFLWWAASRRTRTLARFGNPRLVARLTRSVNRQGRRVRAAMFLLAVVALVTALARPQFGTRVETVRRVGQDIVVALDLSTSMLAEDVAPNRLEKAKHAIESLIDQLQGDRIGLVAFAGDAFVQSPLTVDYGAALMFLRTMEPDLMPVPGTDVVKALRTCLGAFSEESEQHRVVILMTDGEDHVGGIDDVVAEAAKAGVVIYTVGMGSPDGTPIPNFVNGRRQGFKRDENGDVVVSRLDETTLQSIADATGGRYFRGTPGESEIDELASEIEGMEGREIEAPQVTQFDEQFQIFLGLAMILLAGEYVIPDRRRVEEAWRGRFQ